MSDSSRSEQPRPRRPRSNLQRPRTGEVRVRLGALGLSPLGVQAVGRIEAVGPEAAGFAPGDRVAYRFSTDTQGLTHIIGERELIGFPKDVRLEQAAALLPLGLVARTIVKQLRPIGRGNRVWLAKDDNGADVFVQAWARHLGAVIVKQSEEADVVITSEDYRLARSLRSGSGIAQIAASEVFEAVRLGVFEGLQIASYPLSDADKAKSAVEARKAPGPVVVLAA